MKKTKSLRFTTHHSNAIYGNVYVGKVVHDVAEKDADALVKAGLAEYCAAVAKSLEPSEAQDDDQDSEGDESEGDGNDSNDDVKATDAAVKFAEENGIDLAEVTGTGKDGSITKGDVEKFLEEKNK